MCLLTYPNVYRAHDYDEVVWKHPFSSGKPISNDEPRAKRKQISCGHKSDHSGDESGDGVDSSKQIIQWRLGTLKGPNWNRNDCRQNVKALSL